MSSIQQDSVIEAGSDKHCRDYWIFGYGSLIWKPAFEHIDSQRAVLEGFERCFCQASHDHRGTPGLPGRVVTLVPVSGGLCTGMAYRLPQVGAEQILEFLDLREQDGYERQYVPLQLASGLNVDGLTWIASAGNPSWRSGESLEQIAAWILRCSGPSGSNLDYLLRLEEALNSLQMPDTHVSVLSDLVRRLSLPT